MTAHAAVPRPAGTGPRRMAVGGVLLTVPAVVLFLLMLLAPLLFALPSAAVHALLAVAAVAGLVGAGFVVAHAVAAGRGGRILAAVAVLALASLHAAAVAAAVLSPSSHLGELGTTVMFGGGLLLAVAGLLCWVDSGGRAELRRRRG
ncbi:hypothetical protein [Micrococcus lacusdianchii]|uniref:hypothetical protein n=1 Tax=Micrococcus lacusdianchii TaxID=2915940 RepID=UPI0020061884|nr:hypothetical protein [Micrococcus sp. JXJ CY 30]